MNFYRIYFTALLISEPPVYSGKYRSSGTYKLWINLVTSIHGLEIVYFWQLMLEHINFVEEKNDRRRWKPPWIDDWFEQDQRFNHMILQNNLRLMMSLRKKVMKLPGISRPIILDCIRLELYKKLSMLLIQNSVSIFFAPIVDHPHRTYVFCQKCRSLARKKRGA